MTNFAFEIDIPDLAAPRTVSLTATAQERDEIAARLGVVAITALTASITVSPLKKNRILQVTGTVAADLTQACVVSLEPFAATVNAAFDDIYDRNAEDLGLEDENSPWDQAADIPEFLEGDRLDLAEIAIQHLSLSLNPFPRKPDAKLAAEGGAEGISLNEAERENPFAALAKLKSE